MNDVSYRRWSDEALTRPPGLSVVIPTYNERERIVPTIAAIAAHLAPTGQDFEIVVSDDGSRDGTPDLVRSLSLPNVIVLDPGVNRGKGRAVAEGVSAARGEEVLFTDADLSTPIEFVDTFLDALRGGADVVIGSRRAGSASHRSQLRDTLSKGLQALVRFQLALDVSDTQCGFKLFRREAADRLFGAATIDGFAFDLEILVLARTNGYRVVELPVEWHDAPGSKVAPLRTSAGFLWELARLRHRHRLAGAAA